MSYKALYRTYRPRTFEEVAGQTHIVKTLKNALTTGKIAHAYLFTGPRGTGKTTMARLFAKSLNCEQGIGHQCEECENCIAINEGNHPDVIELDAASNSGVDEIRTLIDKVRYSTILGKYKVYIIDEVHMMTPSAFNALLKTLEEPPERVVFILATTEPNKVLPTILSRCQRYDFSKLTDEEINNKLQYVLEKENISFDEEAVRLITSLADGGMRDALSILDQVLAYSGNSLVSEDILNIFSLESVKEKMALLESVFNKDIGDVLNRVRNYIQKGSDIKRLTNDILLILKDILVFKNTNSTELLEILNFDQARKISSNVTTKKILSLISFLLEALKDYKNVSSIAPLFEITMLRMANIEQAIQEEQIPNVKKEIKIEPQISSPIENPRKENEIKDIPPQKFEKNQTTIQPSIFDSALFNSVKIDSNIMVLKDIKIEDDKYQLDSDTIINIMVLGKKDLKVDIMNNWETLKGLSSHPKYGSKASLLVDGHPLVVTNKILLLEFDLPNKVDKINNVNVQEDLQAITQLAFKKKMFVYGISRNISVNLQNRFINLRQVKKLPKIENIQLDFIGD